MQKKLIALAVAAAFSAPAFADATLYGAVDAAIANVSGTGLKGDTIAVSGGAGSSRIGINAAEDLDNGLKAVVNLEYGLDTQQKGGDFAARQELLGVAGSFGTVATGYLQTTGYDWQVKFDPVAGSLVSPLQSMNSGMLIGTIAAGARAQRALAYISPNLSGVTVAVNYSTALNGAGANTLNGGGLGNVAAASAGTFAKAKAYLVSATYAGGPLTVGLVIAKATLGNGGGTAVLPDFPLVTGAQPDVSDMALGASYDLGVAKLMGTYQTSKATLAGATVYNMKAMSFSAVVPVGPGMVGAQYAVNKNDVVNTGASGYLVGYLQPMSKTVTAYAAYESVKNGSATGAFSADNNALARNATTGATVPMSLGASSSVIAVGLRKKF